MGLRDRIVGDHGENPEPIVPTGNTVDAEVEPVKLNIGLDNETPQSADELGNAIAAHFGIEPQSITGFVLAVEHTGEQGTTLSSAWSMATPVWRLKAFAREALEHLGRQGG